MPTKPQKTLQYLLILGQLGGIRDLAELTDMLSDALQGALTYPGSVSTLSSGVTNKEKQGSILFLTRGTIPASFVRSLQTNAAIASYAFLPANQAESSRQVATKTQGSLL